MSAMSYDWRAELRRAREAIGLSQQALAERAGVPLSTLKAYSRLRNPRNPPREVLTAILDALRLERLERNRILMGAGFAADGWYLRPQDPALMFTLDEATEEIERYSWPASVLNEMMEVLAANKVAQRLWSVDLRREFTEPVERNLLSVASNPRFAEKMVNWDEAVATAISVFKGHHRGAESQPEGSGPYYSAVSERFMAGDPRYVRRFLRLWELTPPRDPKVRWSYPMVLEEPGIGTMRFHVFASQANEWDGLTFNDWIPLDAATWQGLEQLTPRP